MYYIFAAFNGCAFIHMFFLAPETKVRSVPSLHKLLGALCRLTRVAGIHPRGDGRRLRVRHPRLEIGQEAEPHRHPAVGDPAGQRQGFGWRFGREGLGSCLEPRLGELVARRVDEPMWMGERVISGWVSEGNWREYLEDLVYLVYSNHQHQDCYQLILSSSPFREVGCVEGYVLIRDM